MWLWVPPSLQLVQTYCIPVPPETGDKASRVCVSPGVQLNVFGVVIVLPSTLTKPQPSGLDVTVISTVARWKFAVIVPGPFIFAVVDAEDGLVIIMELVLVLHDEKT